jgi:hypothetical protein
MQRIWAFLRELEWTISLASYAKALVPFIVAIAMSVWGWVTGVPPIIVVTCFLGIVWFLFLILDWLFAWAKKRKAGTPIDVSNIENVEDLRRRLRAFLDRHDFSSMDSSDQNSLTMEVTLPNRKLSILVLLKNWEDKFLYLAARGRTPVF